MKITNIMLTYEGIIEGDREGQLTTAQANPGFLSETRRWFVAIRAFWIFEQFGEVSEVIRRSRRANTCFDTVKFSRVEYHSTKRVVANRTQKEKEKLIRYQKEPQRTLTSQIDVMWKDRALHPDSSIHIS